MPLGHTCSTSCLFQAVPALSSHCLGPNLGRPGRFLPPLPLPVCQEILLVLFSKQTENLTIFPTSIAAALEQAPVPSHPGHRIIHLLRGVLASTLTAKSSSGNVSQIMGHLFSKAPVSPLLAQQESQILVSFPDPLPSPPLLIILLLWPRKLFSQVSEWYLNG